MALYEEPFEPMLIDDTPNQYPSGYFEGESYDPGNPMNLGQSYDRFNPMNMYPQATNPWDEFDYMPLPEGDPNWFDVGSANNLWDYEDLDMPSRRPGLLGYANQDMTIPGVERNMMSGVDDALGSLWSQTPSMADYNTEY